MHNANRITQKRLQFRFWLNIIDDDQLCLADELTRLKAARQYSAAIRDGLRLLLSLRAGRVDVLMEMFPWLLPLATSSDSTSRPSARFEPARATEQPGIRVVRAKMRASDTARNFLASAANAGFWD